MTRADRPVALPGIPPDLATDIEERIAEFEQQHEPSVLAGGPGWVPRVKGRDYAVAIAVNALIVVWLAVVLLGGGG